MSFNFAIGEFVDGFFSMFSQTGQYGSDEGNDINRDSYDKGYTLYCFNLTQDLNLEEDHFNGTNLGSVSIDLVFSEVLAATVTMISLAKFENTIEIDRCRQASMDFQA